MGIVNSIIGIFSFASHWVFVLMLCIAFFWTAVFDITFIASLRNIEKRGYGPVMLKNVKRVGWFLIFIFTIGLYMLGGLIYTLVF